MDAVESQQAEQVEDENPSADLTRPQIIAYWFTITLWVLTLGFGSQLLSPVEVRPVEYVAAVLFPAAVISGIVINAQDWLGQALRLFWRPTAVGAAITLIVASDIAVPIGWGRLFVIVLWFAAVSAIVISLMLGLNAHRRRRDVLWLAVAVPLLLAVVGSTAGFRNMDSLMYQVDAGNYEDKAEQALAKFRNDQITAKSGAIVLNSSSGELAVVFPMVSGVPSKQWGLVYLDPASIESWDDRQSNLDSLYSVATSTCEHLRDRWHWCLVY